MKRIIPGSIKICQELLGREIKGQGDTYCSSFATWSYYQIICLINIDVYINRLELLGPNDFLGGRGEKGWHQQHRHWESGERVTADSFIQQ